MNKHYIYNAKVCNHTMAHAEKILDGCIFSDTIENEVKIRLQIKLDTIYAKVVIKFYFTKTILIYTLYEIFETF